MINPKYFSERMFKMMLLKTLKCLCAQTKTHYLGNVTNILDV